jgi:hypothetical protein
MHNLASDDVRELRLPIEHSLHADEPHHLGVYSGVL